MITSIPNITETIWCASADDEVERYEDFLTPGERIASREYTMERRRQWLLGRVAAKRAIREHLKLRHNFEISYTDIEIVSSKFDRPGLALHSISSIAKDMRRTVVEETSFSISHTDDIAIASACSKQTEGYTGVDIERIRPLKERVIRAYMTPRETSEYSSLSGDAKIRYSVLVWSAKESYLKAVGTGLLMHPNRVEINVDLTADCFGISVDGLEIDAKASYSFIQDDEYVVTQTLVASK